MEARPPPVNPRTDRRTDVAFLECGVTAPTQFECHSAREDYEQKIRNTLRQRKVLDLRDEGRRLAQTLNAQHIQFQVPKERLRTYSRV